MQFLNDDSTEWMRKAAADYPVKPFGMNWEAVAEQLRDNNAPVHGGAGYVWPRYAAMIVFFMLLSLVCNKYLRIDFSNRFATTVNKEFINSDIVKNGIKKNAKADKKALKQNQYTIQTSGSTIVRFEKEYGHADDPTRLRLLLGRSGYTRGVSEEWTGLGFDKQKGGSTSAIDLPNNPHSVLQQEIENVNAVTEAELQEKLEKKNHTPLNKRLYAGLLLGPDVSSVKLQKTEGVGYNVGLFVGYKLSAKWQLESGFLLNRKAYYSEGEYFSMEHTYLPTHSYITQVDGYCNMFEIPVNVRYNIRSKEKNSWFATAGISSYLMNKEDYNYTYTRYNVAYKGSSVYRNASKDWMSVVNASVGYESAINQKIQFRIEPYLKLPLRGVGTGKLPISSAGMNIGVSYPIK
ncbi:MAG TPA: outer membrane beta-barrel protein [Flavisolibacter sp.]|nr:outer membrane beta-barrel protein [Flavisolibacter sp.]